MGEKEQSIDDDDIVALGETRRRVVKEVQLSGS
jgi:hypothetical protein